MKSTLTQLWFDTRRVFARKPLSFWLLFCASPTSHLCSWLTGAKVTLKHCNAKRNLHHLCDTPFKCTCSKGRVVLGFWIKRSTYEEQPVVKFQYQTLLVAATSTLGDYVAWSTYPNLNNMLGANLRIPAVSVRRDSLPPPWNVHLCPLWLDAPNFRVVPVVK